MILPILQGGEKMGIEEKATIKRIGRSTAGIIIAEGVKYATASPYSIFLIPLIAGLGKFLRAKFGWSWLPF